MILRYLTVCQVVQPRGSPTAHVVKPMPDDDRPSSNNRLERKPDQEPRPKGLGTSRYTELKTALMEESRRRVNSCPGDTGSMPTEAVVQFVGGGVFGLLMWWGNGEMRMPVEEVNALFRWLAIPAVKAAVR
jgi:hypothetical protein